MRVWASRMWKRADSAFPECEDALKSFHLLCTIFPHFRYHIDSFPVSFYRNWLNNFPSLVSSRRSTISLMTNRSTAISVSSGILTILDTWINDSSVQEIFSLGVVSTGRSVQSRPVRFSQTCPQPQISLLFFWKDIKKTSLEYPSCSDLGHFGLPAGLVFCVPVTFQKGEWSVCSDIIISEELQKELDTAVNEITAVSEEEEKNKTECTDEEGIEFIP